MSNDLAIQFDAALWKIVGSCLEGKLHLERGEFEESTTLLSKSLDLCERTGWQVNNAVFLGDLALGLAVVTWLGSMRLWRRLVERSFVPRNSGERWHDAELFRIKGEMLLQKGLMRPPPRRKIALAGRARSPASRARLVSGAASRPQLLSPLEGNARSPRRGEAYSDAGLQLVHGRLWNAEFTRRKSALLDLVAE